MLCEGGELSGGEMGTIIVSVQFVYLFKVALFDDEDDFMQRSFRMRKLLPFSVFPFFFNLIYCTTSDVLD